MFDLSRPMCTTHLSCYNLSLMNISLFMIYRKRLHLYLFKLQLWQNYSIYVWLDRVSLSFYSVCFVPLLQISHPSRTEHDQSNKIIRIPIQVVWSQTFHGLLSIELISITYNFLPKNVKLLINWLVMIKIKTNNMSSLLKSCSLYTF